FRLGGLRCSPLNAALGAINNFEDYHLKFRSIFFLALIFSGNAFVYADELDLSQYEGKNYEFVKNEFLTKGWVLVPKQEGETSINEQYPEVVCGSGQMAICSVGFKNKHSSVAFVVKESDTQLIVSGEY
ncbi:hypothetical protein, partial [Vibrio parahaemolyticus]|uniref:hypothetical protein n=1 Tax=Vibrio parahaemolyticus TaxID=670 RepID=UPI001C60B5FF